MQVGEADRPIPRKGEVLVQLSHAALNHRDIWIWKEQTLEHPVILGSDGFGSVREVGESVDLSLIGKDVVINPSLYWGDKEHVSGPDYQILGNPTNGTFAEFIAIPREYVHEKPTHLSAKEAAALPLAALTAYRALFTKAGLTSGDKVLITGIGGGAALYLLQMAVAAGATVYVTSSSPEKIKKAISLGAKGGYNYKDEHWVAQAQKEVGGFDVIVDSAGGNGFVRLTEVASPGARIVIFGRTAGDINGLKPGLIYYKQLHIMGTLMGTPKEFEAMLAFYQTHQLRPVLDKEFALEAITDAFAYMESGNHFGKVVLTIQ